MKDKKENGIDPRKPIEARRKNKPGSVEVDN